MKMRSPCLWRGQSLVGQHSRPTITTEKDKSPYRSPTWLILNLEISAIFLASVPVGWFDRVMVWGSTVAGSCGTSCTTVSLQHLGSCLTSLGIPGPQDGQMCRPVPPTGGTCHRGSVVAAAWRASCCLWPVAPVH